MLNLPFVLGGESSSAWTRGWERVGVGGVREREHERECERERRLSAVPPP